MFYIYVEIFSWKQLSKVEPELISELKDRIEQLVLTAGGNINAEEPWIFGFSSFYKESLWKLLDTLFSIKSELDEQQDQLLSYSVVLLEEKDSDKFPQKRLEQLCYRITKDRQIWLDPQCRYLGDNHLNIESHKEIYQILSSKARGPLLPEGKKIICSRPDLEGYLNNLINKEKNRKKAVVIRHDELKELTDGIGYWLEDNNISDHTLIIPCGTWQLGLYPFFLSLDEEILRLSGGWKNLSSKALLLALVMKQFNAISRDYLYLDFKQAYLEYLDSWTKYCAEKGRTAVLVIEEPQGLKQEGHELLNTLLYNWDAPESCLIVLLSTENKENNEFTDLHQFVLTKRKEDELKQALVEAFPEISDYKLNTLTKSDAPPTHSSQWFLAGIIHEKGKTWKDLGNALRDLFSNLDENSLQILNLIYNIKTWIDVTTVGQCLSVLNLDHGQIIHIIDRLRHLGLLELVGKQYLRVCWGEQYWNQSDLDLDCEVSNRILKDYRKVLYTRWVSKGLAEPQDYLLGIDPMDESTHDLETLNLLIQWLLENRLFMQLEYFFESLSISNESMQNIVNSGKLALGLLSCKKEQLQEKIDGGEISLGAAGGEYMEDARLQLARYYQMSGDPDQALTFSKEALFGFQKRGNHHGEVFANIELALSLLAQQKLGPSLDYFEIARRIADQLNQSYGLILASSLETMAIFLFGNLSLALRNIQQQVDFSTKEGRKDREFFLRFLHGRILFELGEYGDAEKCFSILFNRASSFEEELCSLACKRWHGRSLIYQGNIIEGLKLLDDQKDNREALFFLSEGDFFSRKYESALEHLSRAKKMKRDHVFNWSEKHIWSDGYQVVEGWLYSSKNDENILDDQIEGFYLYLLAKTGQNMESVQGLTRLIKKGDHPFRPYSHKYFYLCSKAMQNNMNKGTSEDDCMVLLSKAIEKLQSRAGRFDDQKKKMSYLQKNYWNKCIIDEAQKKKFI